MRFVTLPPTRKRLTQDSVRRGTVRETRVPDVVEGCSLAVVAGACAVMTSAVAGQALREAVRPGASNPSPAVGNPAPADSAPSTPATPPRSSAPGPAGSSSPVATTKRTPTTSGPPPGPAQQPPPMPQPITGVAAYGAVGNGRTDSTIAIGRAVVRAPKPEAVPCTSRPDTTWSAEPGIGSGIEIRGGHPLTIAGAGRDLVTLTNTNASGGLLSIRVDHTVVEGLTLDAQTSNTRQALGVGANNVTVQNCRILGGRQFFAIYYAGPPGASPIDADLQHGQPPAQRLVSDLVAQRWHLMVVPGEQPDRESRSTPGRASRSTSTVT